MIDASNIRTVRVEFENTLCPQCCNAESLPVYSFEDEFGVYAIVRCTRCQLSYLNPRPTSSTIGRYYEAAQYTPFLSSGNQPSLFNRIYSIVRNYSIGWKRKRIGYFKKRGSVLDIGCGTGEFLLEMKSHGWTAAGLEPSNEASQFARNTYLLDVQTGSINEENLKQLDGPFDVITMWHVLEHVHLPVNALTMLRQHLSEDGLLLIALPNISSFDARVYKRDWVALDVPRHLLHFTPESLEPLLAKSGMEIIKQHQMPLDTIFNSMMSEKKIIDRNSWFAIPFLMTRMIVTTLVSWIIGVKRNKGSSILYYVRKN